MQISWLGFEHPIQTGTTHVSQALASQPTNLYGTTQHIWPQLLQVDPAKNKLDCDPV